MAAERGLVINKDDLVAINCHLEHRFQASRAPADNRHVRVPVTVLVIAIGGSRRWWLTQPGDFANERLGGVPDDGMSHRLVIPPHGHQPIKSLHQSKPVSLE